MNLKDGDHICGLYSTATQLAHTVGGFLADGLARGERCWYVASGDETDSIEAVLYGLNVDVAAETARHALKLIPAEQAYVVRGGFDPELTVGIFNNAIEEAYSAGFTAFRAAADMSWAVDIEDGAHLLVTYEALLRSLFANCRAVGLCLYNRERMPLPVIDAALATHPIAGTHDSFGKNPFYDATVNRLRNVEDDVVLAKLERLGASKSTM